MFIRSPVKRSPASAEEPERSPGAGAREYQAKKTIGKPGGTVVSARSAEDILGKHLSKKAADGWMIDQYAVTARDDGFTHHIVWYKADT